jgi:hypothetical protein
MVELKKQYVSMKFCFQGEKDGMEAFEMSKVAFGERANSGKSTSF